MNSLLQIPLADYEGHMSLPQVAQASLLSDLFGQALQKHRPDSVAVLGCAGGNGFERIDPVVTRRLVGIDINPAYIAAAADRFGKHLPNLQLLAADVERESVSFEPVAMIYAALFFEYINAPAVLAKLPSWMKPAGVLCTVVQLPSASVAVVTPTEFVSLNQLSSVMRLVPPAELCDLAIANGLQKIEDQVLTLPSGKQFEWQAFRRV